MKRLSFLPVAVGLMIACTSEAARSYSWQQPHAKVLPTGTLEWAPEPFVFAKGDSVRYIDFEAGNDDNAGTKEKPWQHHPWDSNATGQAKACRGIHTYVFKCGVIYRGAMKALESGVEGNPIRLTSDPQWGRGEAMLFGSVRLPAKWQRCTAADAPGIPDPTKVWYADLGPRFDKDSEDTKMSAIWRLNGDKVVRLHIARDPNWTITDPDDPTSNWYRWETFDGISNTGWLADAAHFAGRDPKAFDGSAIWTQHRHLMGTVHKVPVQEYDPAKGAFKVSSPGGAKYTKGGPTRGKPESMDNRARYYIENARGLLDSPGEYYFDGKTGRLFLRLEDDSDPNKAVLEAAQIRSPIQIWDKNYIEVSGLMFRFNDDDDGAYGYPWYISASPGVRIVGNCRNITVKNCKFYNVMNAVVAFARPGGGEDEGPAKASIPNCGVFADDVMDNIVIADNDVRDNDMTGAIWVEGSSETRPGQKFGVLKRAEVLRNRVINAGYRPGKSPTSSLPAIHVDLPETAEIAGNVVDTSWGSGIFTFGSKRSGAVNEVPLARMLIHHNQLDNTMLACNDYGGLEMFQGGPAYIYNNVSRNAVGTKTFIDVELGYNLYLDGGFKISCFNNILAGKIKPSQPSYYNNCGYFMVLGFMDHLFNNTIYHFDYAINGSSGNRGNVLGNVMADCAKTFIGQNRPGDVSMMGGGDTGEMGRSGIATLSYANNVFWGKPKGERKGQGAFGFVGGVQPASGRAPLQTGNTLEELRAALESMQCRLSTLGQHVADMPLRDPAKADYRLTPTSAARDAGVKFFVPWGLSRVVGEWNFYKSEHNPRIVLGENFYMQEEFMERLMYHFIPRNDLSVSAAKPADYVAGPLEDWIPGALQFDGQRVAVLTHADMTRDMAYPYGIVDGKIQKRARGDTTTLYPYEGKRRRTLDMSTNNFLVEVYFRTVPDHTGSVLAEKMGDVGYRLQIDAQGAIALQTSAGSVTGGKINDGRWHHVIAEADRVAGKLRIYVDGKPSGMGDIKEGSLSNTADFVVGKGFKGALDFLRVSRGTLADAKTTIEELYEWEFNGPQHRDFAGVEPSGKRDAGALELQTSSTR